MKNYLLVKFAGDWADEFTVYGFRVFTAEGWAEFVEDIPKDKDWEYGFGTNEALEFSSRADFLHNCKTEKIDESTAKLLKKLFGSDEWGIFPYYESNDEE